LLGQTLPKFDSGIVETSSKNVGWQTLEPDDRAKPNHPKSQLY